MVLPKWKWFSFLTFVLLGVISFWRTFWWFFMTIFFDRFFDEFFDNFFFSWVSPYFSTRTIFNSFCNWKITKSQYLIFTSGLESEQESELVDWITEAGGDIVSIEEKNEIDYLITGRASERMSCEQYKIIVYTCAWLVFKSGL